MARGTRLERAHRDLQAADPARGDTAAACAHLAVGEREDAYLALRDAQDALPRPAPGQL